MATASRHCNTPDCKVRRRQYPCGCCICVTKRAEDKASYERFIARQEAQA